MILQTLVLTFDTARPVDTDISELRGYFTKEFAAYTRVPHGDTGHFIHRYPVLQCKIIKHVPTVIGINEGAVFLRECAGKSREIRCAQNTYSIVEHDISLKEEEFGPSGARQAYEFVTPWLALTQENYRKFYKLTSKPERDQFMQGILTETILSLSKTLGCEVPDPVSCDINLHFQKDRFKGDTVMTFTGKFEISFQIPEYLGIGKSVTQGYGTVRRIYRGIRKE